MRMLPICAAVLLFTAMIPASYAETPNSGRIGIAMGWRRNITCQMAVVSIA